MSYLIFFDHTCPLCQRAVKRIQEEDTEKKFLFYPLTSQKAKECLSEELLKGDTLVLQEPDGRQWTRAKGVFRILQLLGGKKAWMGHLIHIPGIDLFYRLVAHHRHFFK